MQSASLPGRAPAPLSRARYSVMALVFAGAVITYLDRVCISVAAPAMQADLGLTQLQFAYVFTAFNAAYAIFEMPASWLGDRWGQRRALARIVAWWSVFTALTGMVRSYWTLLAARFLFGAGEAGAFPTFSRALSRWFPIHERSRANGLMWTGARFGGAISPALAVVIIGELGWRTAFAAFGAIGLIWCVIWYARYRDDPAEHHSVSEAELKHIRIGYAPPPARSQSVPWRRLLLNRQLSLLFFAYFASGFGFQFFVTWLPTYLMREHGLTLAKSGFYAALPLLGGAAGCALGGIIADALARRTHDVRLARRLVGAGGFWLGAAGFFGTILAGSPEAAIVFLVCASGFHDLTLPVTWATCTDLGGRYGGTASGWMNLASSLSGMTAPIASSLLEQAFGSFHAVFYVAAAVYLVGGALWLLIDPRKPAIT